MVPLRVSQAKTFVAVSDNLTISGEAAAALKELGTIVVRVSQKKKQAVIPAADADHSAVDGSDPIPEKALKGQALSHRVQ